MGLEEDRQNKSDRPLPAGRISLRDALILRWVLVPVCWVYSVYYSLETFYASLALSALTFLYDEMGAHASHWAIRNIVNACGFASFEAGATLIASMFMRHTTIFDDSSNVGQPGTDPLWILLPSYRYAVA